MGLSAAQLRLLLADKVSRAFTGKSLPDDVCVSCAGLGKVLGETCVACGGTGKTESGEGRT